MSSLSDYKDRFSGRIFLCGNGPSMKKLTKAEKEHLAEHEYTFAGSRWFEWEERWTTSFYVLTERKQAQQWLERGFSEAGADIARFFLEWQPAPPGWVGVPRPPSNAHDVLNYGLKSGLLGQCADGVDPGKVHSHHGKDTPLMMAQLAYYMGFREFYLLGCETEGAGHSYSDAPVRNMHAPGIMNGYYQRAASEIDLKDCTPGGSLTRPPSGPLEYVPLKEVIGIGV